MGDTRRCWQRLAWHGEPGSSPWSVLVPRGLDVSVANLLEGLRADQQIANVLVDYTLLENALGKIRNLVDVVDRFAARLHNLGDSTQIVLIMHQKVFGLCFMTKFKAAVAEQANITR